MQRLSRILANFNVEETLVCSQQDEKEMGEAFEKISEKICDENAICVVLSTTIPLAKIIQSVVLASIGIKNGDLPTKLTQSEWRTVVAVSKRIQNAKIFMDKIQGLDEIEQKLGAVQKEYERIDFLVVFTE